MHRRDFLYALGGSTAGVFLLPELSHVTVFAAGKQRGLRICVDKQADPVIQKAASSLAESAASHPLLKIMTDSGSPATSDTRSLIGSTNDLAYNHLILVGLPSDPLIAAAWQREARAGKDSLFIFGFGHLAGDIGYIESDRNPFLHAAVIPTAPFETEVVTLTGTTPAGVALAVKAFREKSLVNGVVGGAGWSRPAPSLLDRDPLSIAFDVPALAPPKIGDYTRIALTQASEDEYRGVLADTGIAPRLIWRAKYFKDGGWNSPGQAAAFDNYSAGLHRRAYGNTLWLAAFASSTEAGAAAPKVAEAAQLKSDGDRWTGAQPLYANNSYPGEKGSPGKLTLWQQKEWLLMSTIPQS